MVVLLIKWSKVKKIILIFINCLFYSTSHGQTLIDNIEYAYNKLDSISYIDEIILSYAKSFDKVNKETDKQLGIIRSDSTISDNIQRCKNIDEICSKYLQSGHDMDVQWIRQFESHLKSSGKPLYVLNLKLNDEHTLKVDTTKLCFNLFYFEKNYNGRLFVYCNDGEYRWQDERFRTFSRKHARNAPKVFRKVLQKHPTCLLFCPDLEGMNTILYLLNNTIYIFKIEEMQEYTLDKYFKKVNHIIQN